MSGDDGSTSATLLERVRDPADAEAWRRFFTLYAPLLERYARALGLGGADALEVRDECLAVVAARMPAFRYASDRGGFRAWLHALARGKVIDRLRRSAATPASARDLDEHAAVALSPDEAWEQAWRREHLRWALDQVRRRVPERAYAVFSMLLLDELDVAEVRRRTGMNANQVYLAKSRVMRRVRDLLRREGVGDDAPR